MKSTKAIINQRVVEISGLLIDGFSRTHIVQYGSDNWNISERQIDKYIAKAREVIQKDINRNIEFDYAKSIKRYENLYKKAIERGDYRLALSVNKEISILQGLARIQVEHSGNIEFISNIPE